MVAWIIYLIYLFIYFIIIINHFYLIIYYIFIYLFILIYFSLLSITFIHWVIYYLFIILLFIRLFIIIIILSFSNLFIYLFIYLFIIPLFNLIIWCFYGKTAIGGKRILKLVRIWKGKELFKDGTLYVICMDSLLKFWKNFSGGWDRIWQRGVLSWDDSNCYKKHKLVVLKGEGIFWRLFFRGRKEWSQKERSETTHEWGFSCWKEGFARYVCYRFLHPHYPLVINWSSLDFEFCLDAWV